MNWRGRRVALLGLGRSNLAMARYLAPQGALLGLFDAKSAQELGQAYPQLASLPQVEFHLGEGYLAELKGFEVIFVAPGVKKHLPELVRAQAEGAQVTTEIAHFLEVCPAPVVGITGSSGKTTTTTLVGLMLQAGTQAPVYVGGNIGNVLIEQVASMAPGARVVLELSSFQLQVVTRSPHWGALLNVRPNHLDIHQSFQEYREAKAGIFRFQDRQDWLVFNEDDALTRTMAARAPGRTLAFSRENPEGRGARLVKGELVYRDENGTQVIIPANQLRLRGGHNLANALAALALARLVGVSEDAIRQVLTSFAGVEHRLEEVRRHQGVLYINDSIATTPDRTVAALEAVPGPLLLIAGGYDKGLSFTELPQYMRGRVRILLTLGVTAPRIEAELAQLPPGERPVLMRCRDLAEAVERASQLAVAGETVLLSPASASFDMFTDYEERGRCFKQLVGQLT